MTTEQAGGIPARADDIDITFGVDPLITAALALSVAIDAARREHARCTRAMTPDDLLRRWAASMAGVNLAEEALRMQIDRFVAVALAAARTIGERSADKRRDE